MAAAVLMAAAGSTLPTTAAMMAAAAADTGDKALITALTVEKNQLLQAVKIAGGAIELSLSNFKS